MAARTERQACVAAWETTGAGGDAHGLAETAMGRISSKKLRGEVEILGKRPELEDARLDATI
jgi:hypothetical protein